MQRYLLQLRATMQRHLLWLRVTSRVCFHRVYFWIMKGKILLFVMFCTYQFWHVFRTKKYKLNPHDRTTGFIAGCPENYTWQWSVAWLTLFQLLIRISQLIYQAP